MIYLVLHRFSFKEGMPKQNKWQVQTCVSSPYFNRVTCAKAMNFYPSSTMMICAEITLRNMLMGYTVAYATDGSSPSTVEFA